MATSIKTYGAALYMRLSKEDGEGESVSISMQRKMLTNFAKANNYTIYDEYIDDGISGTTFERIGFLRMRQDIDEGKVNMVILKDLSRLGRNYISTGELLEIYFPSKRVRCIAINDGYDSDGEYTDIAPFCNIINEMVARDTSKKIRSSFETKMKAGEFIGGFAPYGYRKDVQNKNHLVPNPETAAIVREMFELADTGLGPSEIASIFNARGILTPIEYRCSNNEHLDIKLYSKRREWTASGVCKILRNMVYVGDMAQGKTTKVSFKSKVCVSRPKEEWHVVCDTHEALITREQFENVRKRVVTRRNAPKNGFVNIFSGLAKCMDCGRNMSTTGTRKNCAIANLSCGGYKLYGSRECTNHFIDYQTLCDIVLREMRKQMQLTHQQKKSLLDALTLKERKISKDSQETKRKKSANQLQARQRELDKIVMKIYEDIAAERISAERFERMLSTYNKEELLLKGRIEALIKEGEKDRKTSQDNFSKLVEDITEVKELTTDLLFTLIDKIEIGQGYYDQNKKKHQTVRIHYKFIGTGGAIKK